MSELDNVFEVLKKNKLCKSQHAFSRDYLGRASNYYGALKCMKTKGNVIVPSIEVLMTLHLKLSELTRHTDEPTNYGDYHAKQSLITLSNAVLSEIKERCAIIN
jgi:hypothetical protein